MSCDVAAMMSRRWRKSWAPGYYQLLRPVVWLLAFGALAALMSNTFLLAVMIVLGVVSWGLELRRCGRLLPDRKGIRLSLALQGILVAYLAAALALPGALFMTGIEPATWWILALPALAALAILCHVSKRHVAEICLRHYLNGTLRMDRDTDAS